MKRFTSNNLVLYGQDFVDAIELAFPNSINTRIELLRQMNNGEFTEEEIDPQIIFTPGSIYNPSAFRMALLNDPEWLGWANQLPHATYTNLTHAAMQELWNECQVFYNSLKNLYTPSIVAIVTWQGYADTNNIPLVF